VKRYLLDTTALLAHYFEEPGADQVAAILEDTTAEVLLCALSVAEFARRVNVLLGDPSGARTTALEYAELADEVVPVDTAVAIRAFEIASAAGSRVPLVDAAIAAAAGISNAILVHRDHHFKATKSVAQLQLDGSGG
jgi:predicted nucleic acid-binding protein